MALLVSPLHPFFGVGCDSEWQDTHGTSVLGHTHLSDWAVLRCCGWHPGTLLRWNVKCCISLHALPSLVSGKDGNPIMSHV